MVNGTKKNILAKNAEYLFFLLSVIPVFLFRDFTPNNELKYLSIADEAIRDGNIFAFMNHGAAYADKPPLYIWIVMLGKLIFGKHSLLFLGLFSVIPSLAIVRIMDKWVEGLYSEKVRQAGRIMLFTSAFYIGSAVVLRMDMLMCMFIVLSLRTFFIMFNGGINLRNRLLFPVFIFLAVFTKGPVGILVPLFSTVAFLIIRKQFRSLGRYWGWLTWVILILLSAVWFGCVYLEGGKEYFNNLIFNQTVNRAVDSFHHKAPFYYYLKTVWYIIAPWSLLVIGCVVVGIIKKSYANLTVQFFLSVFTVTLFMLSAISSKIEIYFLPAVPFLIYIALPVLDGTGSMGMKKTGIAIPSIIFTAVFPVLLVLKRQNPDEWSGVFFMVAGVILSLSGITSLYLTFRDKIFIAVRPVGIGFLTAVFIGSFSLKDFGTETGFAVVTGAAKEYADNNYISNYYSFKIRSAENMDVYLGKSVNVIDTQEQDPLRLINPPALLFIRKYDYEKEGMGRNGNSEIIGTYGSYSIVVFKN